ncbi:MAG: fold-4 domain protein [Gemmatimonadetes bacterium]|nr:fold-4 domain protein [Gemmatimonadota bacterium]
MVQTWDEWLAAATRIPESAAIGVAIGTLFPDLAERGLLARMRRVAEKGGVEVLAPVLHKYLLPCPPLDPASRLERMRQHVVIAPIDDEGGIAGITVTIEDVTARFDRHASADLDSHSETTRLRAATAIAERTEESALLANALADDSWRVRRVAAEGLAASTDGTVVDTLLQAIREHHQNPALLNAAITALGRKRHDVAPAILPLLQSDDADVRTYAALALGLVGDPRAARPLIAALDDVDTNVGYHAIEALGRIGDGEAANTLARIAESRDFFLAFPAVDALAAIGEASVAPRLLALLDDPFLAPATAACLGGIGTIDVVAPLAATLQSADAPAGPIAAALAALSERLGKGVREIVATTTTPDLLLSAVDGADDETLRGLVVVLSWFPSGRVDIALASLMQEAGVRRLVADTLARRGVRATPVVEEMARHADAEVRRAAAFALGGIGSPTSVKVLLDILADSADAELTTTAIVALGAIGDARAFTRLLDFLDCEDATVRQAAIGALSSIAHPDLEDAIMDRFVDQSPRVRESAARLAGYFAFDSCLTFMLAAARDEDALVRRAAVESLSAFDADEAWSMVCTAVRSDADATVRAAGARALGVATRSECRDMLLAALRDSNLWVRYFAARSCARREEADVDTVSALLECFVRDRAAPVRVAAIETLNSLGVGNLFEPLAVAANDADDDVSCAALRALAHYPPHDTGRILRNALEHGGPRQQQAAREALTLR